MTAYIPVYVLAFGLLYFPFISCSLIINFLQDLQDRGHCCFMELSLVVAVLRSSHSSYVAY